MRESPVGGVPDGTPEVAAFLEQLQLTASALERAADLGTYKLVSTTVLPLLRAGFPERVTPGAAAAGKFLDL